MASLLALTESSGGKVVVNADQITFMAASERHPHLTVIKLACGATVTVREDACEIAYRVSDDPSDVEPPDDSDNGPDTIANITHRIVSGSLTPGERVEMQSVVEYEDGETQVNRLTGTFVATRTSEFPGNEGVDYHYFRDGSVNGTRQGSFGVPADTFRPPP